MSLKDEGTGREGVLKDPLELDHDRRILPLTHSSTAINVQLLKGTSKYCFSVLGHEDTKLCEQLPFRSYNIQKRPSGKKKKQLLLFTLFTYFLYMLFW